LRYVNLLGVVTDGEIILDGEEITDPRMDADAVRRKIGLMATHEMGFARGIADQVCFLADGVVAESGPPEQVLGAPEHPRLKQFLSRVMSH
jgi:polar amino acid transport system ATP-binding protein